MNCLVYDVESVTCFDRLSITWPRFNASISTGQLKSVGTLDSWQVSSVEPVVS